MIASAHEWVKVVPNTKEATLAELFSRGCVGQARCAIGRLRKMNIGSKYLTRSPWATSFCGAPQSRYAGF